MKLFIVLTLAVCAHGGNLDRGYLPPSYAQTSGGSGNFLQTPFSRGNGLNGNGFAPIGNGLTPVVNGFGPVDNGFVSAGDSFVPSGTGFANNVPRFNAYNRQSQRPQAAYERNAAIIRQYNENNVESYAYGYETENGISAEENGVAVNGVEAQGGYSYTGDDGRVYSVRYTADQNGFRPVGDHLPTPPPIPEEIQKALDQNARDEAAGIFDDGSYNGAKYGTSVGFNRVQSFPANQGPVGEDDTIITDSALVLDNDTIRPPGYKNQLRNQARKQAQQGFQPQNYQTQGQISNQAFQTQNAFNSANKAYLPPFVQRNFIRNQNGGRFGARPRPSFDARSGYRY